MPLIKCNNIFLNEIEYDKINKTMMSKQDKKNCFVVYCLTNIFKLSNSIKDSMSRIEQCFPMFVDSDNFFRVKY